MRGIRCFYVNLILTPWRLVLEKLIVIIVKKNFVLCSVFLILFVLNNSGFSVGDIVKAVSQTHYAPNPFI
jgi:hypothetical protein